jgi:hypothetical protein
MKQVAQIRLLVLGLPLALCGILAGCATDSARPGTVCGHCDYRFSHVTPNPCDPCVPELVLPGYGHTPTTWQVWSEGVVYSQAEPTQQMHPLEDVAPPNAVPMQPPSQPMPPTNGMLPPTEITAEAMSLPDPRHPRALLR